MRDDEYNEAWEEGYEAGLKHLEAENKRLREALEKIRKEPTSPNWIKAIAMEALDGNK
jgi:hypothetical protein